MNLTLASSSHNGDVLNSKVAAGFTLTETAYAPNLKVPKHSHRHACFCLVLQGAYTEQYRRTALECRPSSVVFRPADEQHSNHFGSSRVRCFIIEFESDWLSRLHYYSVTLDPPTIFRNSSLIWSAIKLRSESRQVDSVTPLVVEGLMLELTAEAWRSSVKFSARTPPHWLKLAREILHDQFSEHLTLSDIARSVGVHPVYLASGFRHHYRCSVGEYLRRLRIEFACREISATDAPLVDVALAAGFSHQSHFSRTFKRLTGQTPAKYRAQSKLRSS